MKEEGGIYEINFTNCKSTYVGQTCRNFKTRLKEHENSVINQEVTKSTVASHMLENGHFINHKKSGLIKKVGNKRKLDAMESYFIQNFRQNLMNIDEKLVRPKLFELPPSY